VEPQVLGHRELHQQGFFHVEASDDDELLNLLAMIKRGKKTTADGAKTWPHGLFGGGE